jgi:hypothetical protein
LANLTGLINLKLIQGIKFCFKHLNDVAKPRAATGLSRSECRGNKIF